MMIGPAIGLEMAKKAAAAAHEEAVRRGLAVAVAVVDPYGTLVYYEKMDNAQIASADLAVRKARSSALFNRPTKSFADKVAAGGAGLRLLALPEALPIEGGIPLIADEKIVGAIGLSGGSGEEDGICAQAGQNAISQH